MRELEKTKRISISGVLILALLLVGFLGFKMPDYVFKKTNKETLDKVIKKDYLVSKSEVFAKDYAAKSVLIDTRSEFEFNKGHFKDAINIPTSHLFVDDNMDIIEDYVSQGKDIVLYGKSQEQANIPWMMLYQLDIPNLKILTEKVDFKNNKFISEECTIEKPGVDYVALLKKAEGLPLPERIKKVEPEIKYVKVVEKVYVNSGSSTSTSSVKSGTINTTKPGTIKTTTKKTKKRRKRKKGKKKGGC